MPKHSPCRRRTTLPHIVPYGTIWHSTAIILFPNLIRDKIIAVEIFYFQISLVASLRKPHAKKYYMRLPKKEEKSCFSFSLLTHAFTLEDFPSNSGALARD